MTLNDSNFLIWYDQNESQFMPNLPRPFVREPEILSPVVWLVPGEVYSFYLNSTDGSAPAGTIKLVDERGVEQLITQELHTATFPGGSHLYGTFSVPQLPEGFARLKLGNYLTQYLWISTATNAAAVSALVKFRNADRLMSFRYRYLPTDFYQLFRVRLAMKTEEPEVNKTV